MIIKKVVNKIRKGYWKVVSKSKKKAFENNKVDVYQYKDDFFCSNIETLENLKRANSRKDYWKEQETYSIKKYFPKTYAATNSLLFDSFIPLFNEKPDLLDIGCASGEWTMKMAPFCNSIDGYEYSKQQVDTANRSVGDSSNIHFYQGDAKSLELSKTYDGATILAMLMYIEDPEDIYKILKNVYLNLKTGAYLCTRDTMNNEGKQTVYMYNRRTGYEAVYYSKDMYYQQFRKAGFVMKNEYILDNVTTEGLYFIHLANIWQKPID